MPTSSGRSWRGCRRPTPPSRVPHGHPPLLEIPARRSGAGRVPWPGPYRINQDLMPTSSPPILVMGAAGLPAIKEGAVWPPHPSVLTLPIERGALMAAVLPQPKPFKTLEMSPPLVAQRFRRPVSHVRRRNYP